MPSRKRPLPHPDQVVLVDVDFLAAPYQTVCAVCGRVGPIEVATVWDVAGDRRRRHLCRACVRQALRWWATRFVGALELVTVAEFEGQALQPEEAPC